MSKRDKHDGRNSPVELLPGVVRDAAKGVGNSIATFFERDKGKGPTKKGKAPEFGATPTKGGRKRRKKKGRGFSKDSNKDDGGFHHIDNKTKRELMKRIKKRRYSLNAKKYLKQNPDMEQVWDPSMFGFDVHEANGGGRRRTRRKRRKSRRKRRKSRKKRRKSRRKRRR